MASSRDHKRRNEKGSVVMGFATHYTGNLDAFAASVGATESDEAERSDARKQAFRRAYLLARENQASITPEEDAAITAAAEADPDNRPFTDEDFARAKPGRPPLLRPKQPVSLRLDADVVDALRASGDGWQTRANGMLRKALKLDAE